MPQTSLYMDAGTMQLIRAESQRAGISLSKFIANAVEDYAARKADGWPAGFWDRMYGCLDDKTADEILAVCRNDAAASAGSGALDPALDDACNWFTEA